MTPGVPMILFKRACKLFWALLTTSMVHSAVGPAANADAGSVSSRHRFLISVLSSRPDMVSGGDALVRVDVPRSAPLTCVRVFRNEHDVTAAFTTLPAEHAMQGLVNGFELGPNLLTVQCRGSQPAARLTIVNHPITGPIFSGPHQYP